MKPSNYLFLFFIFTLLFSCKKGYEGDINSISNPETFMAVSKIERTGENRLTTRVDAYWWGTSEKGFITGYEVSVDSMKTWVYTTKTDSSILLLIPFGNDTADLPIFVRAIDNLGQKDLTPASLIYPVRNSAPTILLTNIAGKKPTKSFPAVHFYWAANDADGLQDLNGFEVYLNDTNTTKYNLSNSILDITIMSDNSFSDSCFVFAGTKTKALDARIYGIKYNAWNVFYIKAVDRAGLKSKFVFDSIFIKKPVSKTLFINAYLTSRNTPQNFISTRTSSFLTSFDTLYLNNFSTTLSTYTEQSPDVLTQARVFSFFDKIIWISDEGATSNTLALAQQSTNQFFENGGRMFMMCNFGSDIPNESESFGFTPIQRLASDSSGLTIRMNLNDELKPYNNTWPTLKCNIIISSVKPFFTQSTSSGTSNFDSLYKASLITLGPGGAKPYFGQSNVVSKRISLKNNKTVLVFMSLPIQSLNGNNNANLFLEKILKDELEF
jgi:hypothetical protein